MSSDNKEVSDTNLQENVVEMPKVDEKSPIKADVKIVVKQPKVQKPKVAPENRPPRTEGQIKAMEKMKEALAKKRQEKADAKKALEEAEKKAREDAVKQAEEEAKKITSNVEVQKIRGRKIGQKNQPKGGDTQKGAEALEKARIIPEAVQQRQMTPMEYQINKLREKGIRVPDNVTPYMLKMIMSRYR